MTDHFEITSYNLSISGIVNGSIVCSDNVLKFSTYYTAENFLKDSVLQCVLSGIKPSQELLNLRICLVQTIKTQSTSPNYKKWVDYNDTNYDRKELYLFLQSCCNFGFDLFKLTSDEVENILQNPIFYDTVQEIVPNHIQININKFISNGIRGCTIEDECAIILTSTKELLKIYNLQ